MTPQLFPECESERDVQYQEENRGKSLFFDHSSFEKFLIVLKRLFSELTSGVDYCKAIRVKIRSKSTKSSLSKRAERHFQFLRVNLSDLFAASSAITEIIGVFYSISRHSKRSTLANPAFPKHSRNPIHLGFCFWYTLTPRENTLDNKSF